MKILLVDDTIPAREPLELQLRALGHEVWTADNGDLAWGIYQKGPFDLVMTDIRMPVVDGLELLRRIKGRLPDQDVVMVTGYGDMDSSLEALRFGATNYLTKPVRLEELRATVRSVQEKKELARRLAEQERRLAQARKMADLGVVAAGVAHEINNPNTFIRGNVQTLMKFWAVIEPFVRSAVESGQGSPEKLDFILRETPNILEAILQGSERIKQIVESTAAFTATPEDAPICCADLRTCVEGALRSLEEKTGGVRLEVHFDPALPMVTCSEEDLTAVVVELATNSLTALQGREDPFIEIRSETSDDGTVLLKFEDNGVGIPEENRSRVFTPFFSSDGRIGRPGLGLSKVFALIHSRGGDIHFTSRVGLGSCFYVKLPVFVERGRA